MKKQRYRFKLLALLFFLMFAGLAAYGAFNIINYGNRWFSSSHNTRIIAAKSNVTEGSILDRNRVVLAETVDGQRIFQQDEASRRSVVHIVGDRQGQVANAVETFQTAQLYGFQASLPDTVSALISGKGQRGNDVILTVDSKLCTEIVRSFSATNPGKNGAAAVVDYTTGEVLALVSLPNFDPDKVDESVTSDPGTPFWNRAVRGLYPPGSTFKIITASAALNQLPGIRSESFDCTGSISVDNSHTIHDFQGEVHGNLTLKDAFRLSCNPCFADLALRLGDRNLRNEAECFGFNDNFLFTDLVVENSRYPIGERSAVELAASGIGQSSIVATPLHMALITAGIANNGVIQEPHLVKEISNASGRVLKNYSPTVYKTACTPEIAEELKSFMRSVVQNGGSGWRVNLTGMDICGKTGTAQSSVNGQPVTYGWFIGFNADKELPYALCVLVEDIADGEAGGTTSALVAADIFKYLKRLPSN